MLPSVQQFVEGSSGQQYFDLPQCVTICHVVELTAKGD
jgi:hypothetical protein